MSMKINNSIESKSDKKANNFRELGNTSYKAENMMGALLFYNKAIAFANSKDVISLAYANRSAVYMEIDRYKECLDNIKMARKNGYPKDKIAKLNEREEKCKKLIAMKPKDYENPLDLFKLSYPANEKIPWIIDDVEMKTTKKYGRGIYAKRDLKAGDFISMEEPVIFFLQDDAYYKHCNNCFQSRMMNLIPCVRSASMMFCSKKCKQQFYSKALDFKTIKHTDVKLLSEIVNTFGGREKFEKFEKNANFKNFNKTIFDYDLSNPDDLKYHENLMMCLLSLSTKGMDAKAKSNISNLASRKTVCYLKTIHALNFKQFVNDVGGFQGSGSTCLPLFANLMNHSCMNNIEFIFLGTKICALVMKPVKAGEQLFCCYGNKYAEVYARPEVRQKSLIFCAHKFKCDCDACQNNITFYEPFLHISMPRIQGTYLQIVRKTLDESWNYINKNKGYSQEIAYHSKRCKYCLQILAYYCFFPREDKLKLFSV